MIPQMYQCKYRADMDPPMCKINVFNTQTVPELILHIGGSVRIALWIPGHRRGYTGISMYLKYSRD
jgi:hypothetical protein